MKPQEIFSKLWDKGHLTPSGENYEPDIPKKIDVEETCSSLRKWVLGKKKDYCQENCICGHCTNKYVYNQALEDIAKGLE